METFRADVVRDGLRFGEAPRWHGGRLWYSDFYRHGVFSMAADGSDERREATVDQQPSGLGWLPDGTLLAVSMIDQRVVRIDGDAVTTHCDISEYCGFWANDMTVAESGVAYVGNFGFDLDTFMRDTRDGVTSEHAPATTNLVVIDATGVVLQVVEDMMFPNGMVISPDGGTLIVAETTAYRLTAFDVAPTGTLSNRRVFAQLDGVPADGICLDEQGQVWVAHPLDRRCVRVAEGGGVTAEVTTSAHTFACMLGGEDRRTLFVICAPTSSRFEIAAQEAPLGTIQTVRVTVAGAGTP
jgi:sugar lactone lactonase YvrE